MSVTSAWYNPAQDIVLYVFEGRWTWDELYSAYNQAIAMEKSVPHRVDVVLNMLDSKSVPPNALLHVKNISNKQPDNIGLTIVVTPSTFIQSLFNAGTRFYKGIAHYFRVVPTMEAAMKMIEDDRKARNNQPLGKVEEPQSRPAGGTNEILPRDPHK